MGEWAVAGSLGCRIRLIRWVLEQEAYAIDGLEGKKLRWVESEKFFELDVLDAEVFDEGGKDALTIRR